MRSPRLLLRKQPPSVDRTDAKAGAKAAGTATPDPNSSQGAAQRPLLMRRYRSLLPKGPGRLIVLIADDPLDPELLSYLKVMARDRVHLISLRRPAGSPAASGQVTLHHADGAAEITAVVKTLGAVDLVIVLTPAGGEEHAELWEQLFFAVNAGGAYIVHRDAVVDSGGPDGLLARLVETVALQTNTEVDTDPEAVTDLTSLKIEIAQSAGRLVFDRAFFIVAKRYRHHLKVREAVANDVLPAHGSDISLRVLATLTAGTFASTATVTSHQSTLPVDNLETTISYPELHLREYTGRVGLVAQGLLVTDDLALPDSFRWHQQPDPRNPAAINANPDYLRVKVNDLPSETMAGTYYLLDNSFYGHFGHLMTEVVSKLWGWDLAKAEFPDLKAIYRTRYNWERERLAGVAQRTSALRTSRDRRGLGPLDRRNQASPLRRCPQDLRVPTVGFEEAAMSQRG
jgi:hypothetical protein